MVNLKNERAPKKLSFNNSKTVKVAKYLSVDFDLFAYTILGYNNDFKELL